ncbi:MAG TPA: type II toxin-antitoxin system RelE/ParE family toxin [Micromonosporaceae bacterium]|nr:type II toxin-antitoxin system RelE/ParE family toxin [Micromonosporaceae bacterium]
MSWLHDLRRTDRRTLILISQAIEALSIEGPAIGRPLVDTVKGSTLPNLKELRPGSAGSSEVRLLFVFDPRRQAVILAGGDKAGNWRGWYRTAIPRAETAYADHLARMAKETGTHE